ncbi:zinc-regulated transporter 2 [Monosporozyma servazzii]
MDTSNPLVYLLFKREDDSSSLPPCAAENDFDGKTNLRILAVFMILISSAIGSFFPVLSSKYSFIRLPDWCFFIAKFFGSGVIVATAFVHLLQPANEALDNECLGGTFAEYPWAFGISLMSLFFLFLLEIISHYLIERAFSDDDFDDFDDKKTIGDESSETHDENKIEHLGFKVSHVSTDTSLNKEQMVNVPGKGHYDHTKNHQDPCQIGTPAQENQKENYANQILAVMFLEFGILFHSVFVGLSLAVSGDEFTTLFIVLIFHQMFEGLGLGTRIAETHWPENRKYTPWLMALAFAVTTPIAVAIGIGVRHSFVPGSRKALISNGVFDAISSGILIYTGLVELMAHEFLFSNQFKGKEGIKKMLFAYVIMCLGAGLMALLGKWA